MAEYKPNSHKYKEENKAPNRDNARRVEPVVAGGVKTKKKGDLAKFKNSFVSEDAANVKSYIIMDVLLPAAKKMFEDIVVDGIHMILYGEVGRDRRRSSVDRVSYDRYSRKPDRRYSQDRRSDSFLEYDTITFERRGDAERVLREMDNIMADYGLVRVIDLFDLAGMTCDYPGMDYGWTNINNAEVIRVRDGYTIKMPRAIPIK